MRRFIVLCLLLLLAGCGKPALYQQESYVFGTRVTLSIWGMEESKAQQAASEALSELDRLHAKLHAWRPSDVTRMNAAFARGESAPVDDELAGMLRQAAEYARRSDQLFNPAVGKLIALWGFQRDTFEPVTPDPQAIAKALAEKPSLEDLRFEPGHVSSRNRAVSVDLGGFAKGWALDRLAGMLHARGVKNALINIGGNVLAMGSKDGEPWKVGLQHPRKPLAMATIELHDGEAIGTSGDYQRFFIKDGIRYAHLIDPRTGRPADQVQSATVIVPSGPEAGTLSDAATKPIYIGGPGTALRYAKRFGIHDMLIVDAAGTVLATPTMLSRVVWLEKPTKIVTIE
ncbi:MAG: FAD:protein FMN transferase [Formivibrio sp.]|nr:FAD:protein FMN transferase [Formivibrio sp.]